MSFNFVNIIGCVHILLLKHLSNEKKPRKMETKEKVN